ncbi:MAG: LysR substrate-binding domain-containing protein [Nocardioidaceae bacterium]|nr:LysR substrate-binding domain-containing protein [Nocardioidaceae bacterium]
MEPLETHLRVADPDALPSSSTEDVRIVDDELIVLMSADHPQAHQTLTLDAYLDLVHVKVSPSALGTNVIDDALGSQNLERHVAITVPSWFEMRTVVANTDMVVAMPRRWASDPAFSAGCVWQPLPLDGVAFSVDLRSRRRDHHDLGTLWLRRLITTSVV